MPEVIFPVEDYLKLSSKISVKCQYTKYKNILRNFILKFV